MIHSSFEQTLIEVWRQCLVENATAVELDGNRYVVRRTPKRGLRQVDFTFEGNEIRGQLGSPGESFSALCNIENGVGTAFSRTKLTLDHLGVWREEAKYV